MTAFKVDKLYKVREMESTYFNFWQKMACEQRWMHAFIIWFHSLTVCLNMHVKLHLSSLQSIPAQECRIVFTTLTLFERN